MKRRALALISAAIFILSMYMPADCAEADNVSSEKLLTLQNDRYCFSIDESTACFRITDKTSGCVYASNPANTGKESDELLYSQLTLEYYEGQNELFTLNSYEHSTKLGNTEISGDGKSIKVTYNFGKSTIDRSMIPCAFFKDDFEKLIKEEDIDASLFTSRYKLTSAEDDTDGSLVKEYPALSDNKLYIIGEYTPDYAVEKIYHQLKSKGLTLEELKKYNEKIGVKVEYKEFRQITVPVIYTLNDDGFSVKIPCEQIEISDSQTLTDIKLLPFYDAASANEEGYILLPDGCGALINFNNERLSLKSVSIPIYGNDAAISETYRTAYDERAILPVFGISRTDRGSLAIIENADAIATVKSDISGRVFPYCTVYPDFNIRSYEYITLDSVSSKTAYNIYSQKGYDDDITVRYMLFDSEECGYSDMAAAYRNYLIKGKKLTAKKSDGYPLTIELLGAFKKAKSFLGVPYTKTYALTTFEDAALFLSSLRSDSINEITVKYSGWFNGGLRQQYASSVKIPKALGGAKGLDSFNKTVKAHNVKCFFSSYMQTVNENILNPRINIFSQCAKFIYKDVAALSSFDPATMLKSTESEAQAVKLSPSYLLSPARLATHMSAFSKTLTKKYGISPDYADIGNMLYSDFSSKCFSDRQESLNTIQNILDTQSGFSVNGGDLYTLKNAEHIFSLSTSSSDKLIYDCEVPFTQLVLHGVIPYSCKAINLSDDPQNALLKAVETGSQLNYTLAFRNTDKLKNTDFDGYYSVSYDVWKESIYENYNKIAPVQKKLASLTIKSHRYLKAEVTETLYENGTRAIVNYSDEPFFTDGVTVAPQSYEFV